MSDQQASYTLPNDFVLDLNRSLQVPYDMDLPAPWNLPSRLFQFPITVSGAEAGGARRFGLRHPLLADHPFVLLVQAELRIELNSKDAADELDVTDSTAQWWHAVDLIGAGLWRELLETRRFTTPEHIAGAVAYGLDYSPHDREGQRGHVSIGEARQIMVAFDSPPPADRARTIRQLSAPSPFKDEKGRARCPVNSGDAGAATAAWARIFGIEGGWLKHDASGFLQWTELGRSVYAAGDEATFTEPTTGQGAFAF